MASSCLPTPARILQLLDRGEERRSFVESADEAKLPIIQCRNDRLRCFEDQDRLLISAELFDRLGLAQKERCPKLRAGFGAERLLKKLEGLTQAPLTAPQGGLHSQGTCLFEECRAVPPAVFPQLVTPAEGVI